MTLLATLALSGATGITLALAYDWSPTHAHEVVADQVGGVLGWVWSVHAWAATIVLVLALVHPARAWVTGRAAEVGWRKWLTGVAGLGVLVFAFFSGTVLPWDQQGWEAFQHVQYGFDVLGVDLFDVDEPTQAPLGWAFYAHAFAVPGLLVTVVGVHLWRSTDLPSHARRVGQLAKNGARWAGPLAALAVLLAFLWPPFHGPAPVPRLQLTRPDWPFLWMVPVQRWLDSLGLWALPAGLALLGLAPLIPDGGSRRRRLTVLGIVAAGWLALTLVGLFG